MKNVKNIIIGFGKGEKTLAKFLAQKGEFKENESGHISSEQYDALKTWHEDPWAWGKKFEK